MLTKEHALKIAKKLKAKINKTKKNRPHDMASVYHNGVLIASFGIRRGSKKDAGHDHIPGNLHTPPQTCLGLAVCTVSLEEWVRLMQGRGLA